MGALGLVGGGGALPAVMARQARREGWRIVAFALGDPALLEGCAERVVPCRLGDVGPVLDTLRREGIRHVVLAGRVRKDGLFQGMDLDTAGRRLLADAPDWTDEGLLRTASALLESMGIEILDQRRFLAPWLAPAGRIAGPPLDAGTTADLTRGLDVAREIARLGIGQTVVVRAGVVTAVEAMEGTDAAIRRGLELAGPGATVLKAVAPGHDYRFDIPAIGAETLAACVAGRARAIGIEAGRVVLLDRERVEADATREGLGLVGVAETPGAG